MIKSYLSRNSRTLSSTGEAVQISEGGQFLLITKVSTGDQFEIRIDSNQWIPCWLGWKWILAEGEYFKSVEFRSVGASANMDIECVQGTGDFSDSRLNMVRGQVTNFMDGATVLSGHSQTIAGGATVDLSDSVTYPPPVDGYLRKATIITNMDPASDLELLNSAGEVLNSVLYRSNFLMESSDPIKIKNNTGSGIVTRICQEWYIVR